MKAPEFLVLAFDIGTSSLRTALFDPAGRRLDGTIHQVEYALTYGDDGRAELSWRTLRTAARTCLRATLRTAHRPIRAVGVSAFWHSLLGLDKAGSPLTPIYTWADARCRPDAARLRTELSEAAVHARTGCMLRASFWPAKLRWLRRTDPRMCMQVRRWISPAQWLCGELGGTTHESISMRSGTGLLATAAQHWDKEMLACSGLEPRLLTAPEDAEDGAPHRGKAFPELRGARWFSAIGDGAASNLGSGATHAGVAALNVGTSAALRLITPQQRAAPFGLFRYRVDADRCLLGGAISNAGNLRAWCVRELRLDPAKLERALAARPTPEHALEVDPLWTAERAPDWEEDRHGAIRGITQNTTALDILQAATEATYYRLARIARLLFEGLAERPKLIVSGGIAHSPASLRRLANILNQPLYPNDEPEASLRGAAIYALEQLGEPPPSAPLPRQCIRPNPAHAARYALAQAIPTQGRDGSPSGPKMSG